MARPLRINHPNGWHHVTARGNERREIFRDDRDRAHFCALLAEMTGRFCAQLHAYVLMPNHYHLLVELARPNLSAAMQWLNVSYCVWFNRRHQRVGHLLQGRFKSIVVDPRAWGFRLSAYIHLNPVRIRDLKLGKTERQESRAGPAGKPEVELVKRRVAALRVFRWSSYRAYVGAGRVPDWLQTATVLGLGGGPEQVRAKNYRVHVENQIREGLGQRPWEELTDQVVLGGKAFLKEIRQNLRASPRPGAAARWRREPVALERVIAAVEKARGEKWEDFRDRHGDGGRGMVLCLARKATVLSLSELARAVGLKQDATVSMAIKRHQAKLAGDPQERAMMEEAAQMLNVRS